MASARMACSVPVAWNTRAQDSGQGEAVALKAVRSVLMWAAQRCPCDNDQPAICPLCDVRVDDPNGTCKAIPRTFPPSLLDELNRAVIAHPPKSAQDAAGKGVDAAIWDIDKHGYAHIVNHEDECICAVCVTYKDAIRWQIHTLVESFSQMPAKPGQVGEKYRPISIEEIDKFWTHLREAVFGLPTSEQVRAAFDAIGAVVPAQDGGV